MGTGKQHVDEAMDEGVRHDFPHEVANEVEIVDEVPSTLPTDQEASHFLNHDQPKGSSAAIEQSVTYNRSSIGPFVVFVESEDSNVANLHPVQLGKLLHKSSDSIIEILRAGPNRLKVILKTGTAANCLVHNKLLQQKHLRATIPLSLTQKQGLVYGIPLDITEDEIFWGVETPYKLLKVERMNKRFVENGEVVYKPTKLISLTFQGQTLPDKVKVYKTYYDVRPSTTPFTEST